MLIARSCPHMFHAAFTHVATICVLHAWLFHVWHTINYTRRVCSTPRENVVHANTLRDYLKFYLGATHVHACKNEVIIEQYRIQVYVVDEQYLFERIKC